MHPIFVHRTVLPPHSLQAYAVVRNLPYTGCPRRNVPNYGRVFLMLKHTDITQNTYVQI